MIVKVVADTVSHIAVISLAARYVILPVAVLKFHPVGAVSIIVPLFTFAGMSPLAHSLILISHNVVHAGDVALAALSAEIFPHPDHAVTVTAA